MRKVKQRLLLFSLIPIAYVFLTGCATSGTQTSTVSITNRNIAMAMQYYHESLSVAKAIAPVVMNAIESGNITKLESNNSVSNYGGIVGKVASGSNSLNKAIESFIREEEYNEHVKSPTFNKNFLSRGYIIKNYLGIHYFLDGNTGELDQMYLLELPNGAIDYMSLHWLGGDIVVCKTDISN